MFISFRSWCLRMVFPLLIVLLLDPMVSIAQQPGDVKAYYSPIVRIEVEKGFFLITTDSGILWVQVADDAKPHLQTLSLGDMIDVVVKFRPDNLPPILQSWKLARSQSPCKLFDGKTCRKE